MKVNGFVIVSPISKWDDPNKVIPMLAYTTFALTASEAWSLRIQRPLDDKDYSILVQRWHDRGYRLKEATLEIHI
jgi:hypothetical protein